MPQQQQVMRRQESLVRQPFQGLDHSMSTEDLTPKSASVARCRFEQGFIKKKQGRTAIGGTGSTPLDGSIEHIYNYRKLDSTSRLVAWTPHNIYSYEKALNTFTSILGTSAFSASINPVSAVTYINDMYFTTGDEADTIFSWNTDDAAIVAFAPTFTISGENTGRCVSGTTQTGTLANLPVVAGSVTITIGVDSYTDDGSNNLVAVGSSVAVSTNSINYTTGAWSLKTASALPKDTEILIEYDYTSTTVYRCKQLAVYGERLVYMNTFEGGVWNSQRIRWSLPGSTKFNELDFVDLVTFMGDDEILGSAILQTSLIIYGRRHILECSYTGSSTVPFAFSLRDANVGISTSRALFAEKSIHYFHSAAGLYQFDLSLAAKPIDQKIREWFLDNFNKANWTRFCLTKNDRTSDLIIYYTNSGSVANDKVLLFNTNTGVWTEDARTCTAACYGGDTAQLSIDELSGTINAQTTTIDQLGSPDATTNVYTGDADGVVWRDWYGTNIGTSASILDYESKDFTFDDDGGTCWMGIEFLAYGSAVTVSYSSDEGSTWTSLTAVTLSESWTRYRQDFESVAKSLRFRFYNGVVDDTVNLRWFRPYFLRTSSGGTLPT